MNIVDIIILVFIFSFGVTGFKNGFFKQTVLTVGTVIVFILSYYLKDFIADFLSYNLPFVNFKGTFLGLTSINIIFYQLIAFVFMFLLLTSVLVVLLKVTGVFEKILKFTVVLSIPSKILGFIVGLIEGYIITFILLFFLSGPMVNLKILDESKLMPVIVSSSPVLSNITEKTSNTIDEIYTLVTSYSSSNKEEFNKDAINIMLKNKIIKKEYVEKLIEKGKISEDISTILENY